MRSDSSASPLHNTAPETKDFSYNSGERQTATRFEEIRADHGTRYQLAVAVLKDRFSKATEPLIGLDLFCGNGYGSWLASKKLGAHVLGIDGSADAIAVANEHFSTVRTIFTAKCFPFDLPAEAYDFITCFESVEHVADPDALFAELVRALKPGGVLFVSTPNEATMPLALNAAWFRHHVRHFSEQELVDLAQQQAGGLKYVGQFGQKVYRLDGGRVVGVDTSLEMAPVADCPDPHFFIQIFMKTGDATTAKTTTIEGGCDAF